MYMEVEKEQTVRGMEDNAQRDGAPQGPTGEVSSTSTLLKEISSLRLRLKDLEDDTRSTFSVAEEGQLLAMLRKDLAQVQQEKANLEREFMNQMSAQATEHAAKLEALEKKLQESEEANRARVNELEKNLATSHEVNNVLNEKLILAQNNSDVERYLCLLEEEREMHTKEIEQMKLNLAHTDVEIGESRREMDQLQEQLYESQVEKEHLAAQASELKLELEESRVDKRELEEKELLLEQKNEEIGEMNDVIITLEEHKQLLVAEVTDIRMQLTKMEDEKVALAEPPTPDKSITPDEREALKKSVEELEERLRRFNDKLAERDEKIETLSSSLADERKTNKHLRKELKSLKGSSRSSKAIEKHVAKEKNVSKEVSFLRNQNKVLNDEVKALRQRCAASPVHKCPTPTPDTTEAAKSDCPKTPVRRPPTPLLGTPTASARKRSGTPSSPTISNLVASYERRIASKGTPPAEEPEEDISRATQKKIAADFEEKHRAEKNALQRELEEERRNVSKLQQQLENATCNLEQELAAERETISELKRELRSEKESINGIRDKSSRLQRNLDVKKELVAELRKQLGAEVEQVNQLRAMTDPSVDQDLQQQLEHSQKEVERLQCCIKDGEEAQARLEDSLQAEKHEADKLRERLASIDEAQKESEERISMSEMAQSELAENVRSATLEAEGLRRRIEELEVERSQLKKTLNDGEKETEEVKRAARAEVDQLRLELARSQQEAFQEEKKEPESEEELFRLRDQVGSLKSELENAMIEVETLKSVIVGLKQKLQKSGPSTDEVTALRTRLTELQVERAGLELEHSNQVSDLEKELEIVEVAAEEEIEEREKKIEELLVKVRCQEQEIRRLEEERTQLCTSMNDVSINRKDEIEELRDEIMDMTTKAAAQSREIEALKSKLTDSRNHQDSVLSLRKRIKELEEEIKVTNWASKNQIQQSDLDDLKRENSKLRDCIREVKMDRRALSDRLESLLSDKSSSKSSQVLRDRNSALKGEVEKLTSRLKKMEDSITRFAI